MENTRDIEEFRDKFKRGGFHVIEVIGTGGSGTIYKVQKIHGDGEGRVFAMKRIPNSGLMRIAAVSEINAYRRLKGSPYFPKMHCVFQEGDIFLFLDYFDGGSLHDHLSSNNYHMYEDDAKIYLPRIAEAIGELHENKIIHRDIKLANVVLNEQGMPFLIDFGCSKIFKDGEPQEADDVCGTISKRAPEMITGTYSYGVDWWAFGVLIYEMLTGSSPFCNNATDRKEIERRILEEDPCFEDMDYLSEAAKDVLQRLIEKNPQRRLGVNGVQEVLNHPFLTQEDHGDF